MANLAYLGPEWTFSHELASGAFPEEKHAPFDSLRGVVEAVSCGSCCVGLIPFYNTTRLSIEESQVELVAHKGKVFVTDVLPLNVKHFVGGFGGIDGAAEIRTKKVVFHQVSKWLAKKNLGTRRQRDYPSTSAAVRSLQEDEKPTDAVAIGTLSAFKGYKVPVLERNIQNEPNVTLFFVIKNKQPDLAGGNRILMGIRNPRAGSREAVENIVAECGCNISSNWSVAFQRGALKEGYFFEIDGVYSSLGLTSATTRILESVPNVFILGGYLDKCITRLLWQLN